MRQELGQIQREKESERDRVIERDIEIDRERIGEGHGRCGMWRRGRGGHDDGEIGRKRRYIYIYRTGETVSDIHNWCQF